MEYMVKNEVNNKDLMYIMLVEKGYYHPLAFKCLDRIKEDFERFFDQDTILNARYLSLNAEFDGTFERVYVGSAYFRMIIPRTLWIRLEWPSTLCPT